MLTSKRGSTWREASFHESESLQNISSQFETLHFNSSPGGHPPRKVGKYADDSDVPASKIASSGEVLLSRQKLTFSLSGRPPFSQTGVPLILDFVLFHES